MDRIDIIRYGLDDEYAREVDAAEGKDAEAQEHYAVLYTESHPWKETTFLGVFSSEAKAKEAIQRHMSAERSRLPHARIDEYNYQIFEGEIDQSYWF